MRSDNIEISLAVNSLIEGEIRRIDAHNSVTMLTRLIPKYSATTIFTIPMIIHHH